MVDRRRPCSARQPACRPGSGRGLPLCRSRALSEHPAANGHHPLGALSSSARPWRLTVASLRKASPSPRRGTASASGCAPRQTSRCRSFTLPDWKPLESGWTLSAAHRCLLRGMAVAGPAQCQALPPHMGESASGGSRHRLHPHHHHAPRGPLHRRRDSRGVNFYKLSQSWRADGEVESGAFAAAVLPQPSPFPCT